MALWIDEDPTQEQLIGIFAVVAPTVPMADIESAAPQQTGYTIRTLYTVCRLQEIFRANRNAKSNPTRPPGYVLANAIAEAEVEKQKRKEQKSATLLRTKKHNSIDGLQTKSGGLIHESNVADFSSVPLDEVKMSFSATSKTKTPTISGTPSQSTRSQIEQSPMPRRIVTALQVASENSATLIIPDSPEENSGKEHWQAAERALQKLQRATKQFVSTGYMDI